MQLIDNITLTLKEDLIKEIKKGSKLSIASSFFSIYAFKELKDNLNAIDELRFLFVSPTFTTEKGDKKQREFYIPRLCREKSICGSEFEVRLRNEMSQKAIAKECASWIKEKVKFKSINSNINTNSFAIVDDYVYLPINGFTTVDLGSEKGNCSFNLINKLDNEAAKKYLELFNSFWTDNNQTQDVTDAIIATISDAYKENDPEFIYFITLYNIFNEFLDDISEDYIPNEASGFKNSVIWNKLYDFQKDACLGIINKLEKYNGCILADSVGLGKTFTAISVIKYYENRNKSVLVLCPKKLNENWTVYTSQYKNNPLIKDRLRYDVLYHSDLSRKKGKTNGIDLERLNWGNYDLLVIDESHNFRNGEKITSSDGDEDPKENRYLQLMNKIIKDGVKTKVLMLSATPVNNRFNDLKNQIQLAYEGKSASIDKLLNTSSSIVDIFKNAQKEYNQWSKLEPKDRTTKELQRRLSFDFFEVLDSVTIARSRKHIATFYNTSDIGTFPKRLPPLSRDPHLTTTNCNITYSAIYQILSKLNLMIYSPSEFVLSSRAHKYKNNDSFSGFGVKGRELGIRRLMSINLLKRLESSVNSFRLTLDRIKDQISQVLLKIELLEAKGINTKVASSNMIDSDYDDFEVDSFIGSKKAQFELQDLDYIRWQKYLNDDLASLDALINMVGAISAKEDGKLQQLIEDLDYKFCHPINYGNKKAIIFTAFSDTALYLYNEISQIIKNKYGLNTALVTGDVDAKSTLVLPNKEKLDFNKVLTLFSPKSKDKDKLFPNIDGDIDVLIATDCISEGQNLQDCDYLINYDIHWNPVRIIQRFGRIYRIGSQNEVIQLVNYWPEVNLDEYINLKARVESRMKGTVLTSTGDDNPLSPEEQEDLDYRKEQLQKLQNEVVDLEDMDSSVSIMDLGLNEFKLDLMDFMKKNQNIDYMPFGFHAVVQSNNDMPPGVIYVLKNRNNMVNIGKKNRLHPIYMVYVSEAKEIIVDYLSPKELLNKMRFLCRGKIEPNLNVASVFNKRTRDGKNMLFYSSLLDTAISSIVKLKEESLVSTFLSGSNEDVFNTTSVKGIDDFELVTFLVVI